MTTISVVECVSPVSLRSCGSSFGRFMQTRKRLQCVFPNKRSSPYKHCDQDLRNCGLEGTLISSPIPSPIPRSTLSLYGGRTSKSPAAKLSSSSSDEFCDDELDEEILRCQSSNTPDLFVVGSKPRLHGTWEVPESQSVTIPKTQNNVPEKTEDIIDTAEEDRLSCDINDTAEEDRLSCDINDTAEEDRLSCVSPQNPPPSPINFAPSLDGFVIGGQKLKCPERCHLNTNKRDFNPGFVKVPFHNCIKCEGRVMEEELSQVTLQKRLTSILSRHVSKHNYSMDALYTSEGDCKTPDLPIQTSNIQFFSKLLTDDHTEAFYDIFTEKKRLKKEREFKTDEQMEDQIERDTISSKNSKFKRKDDRNKIRRTSSNQFSTIQRSSVSNEDFEVNGGNNVIGKLVSSNTRADFHLPPIRTKTDTTPTLCEAKTVSQCEPSATEKISTIFAVAERASGGVEYEIRRSWSDVFPLDKQVAVEVKRSVTDSEKIEETTISKNKNSITLEFRSSAHLSSWLCSNKSRTASTHFSPTLTATVHEQVSKFTDQNSKDQQFQVRTAEEETYSNMKTWNVTASSTLIVPDEDIQCSQWVSFNGNNEPVLNTTEEVDKRSDTFLKRLQRSKLPNVNDPSLPSGQQFCFEAMVDKRYNRWKRRRRRKQSESRQVSMIQGSESSDENDERNTAMERIIDRMYEEIHGPAPQTPDGSRDTPRTRNRRRRKDGNSLKRTQGDELRKQDSLVTLYDASSEWKSDRLQSSLPNDPEDKHSQPSKSETVSDDLCSWPYLEQYKKEILKRLQSTPPDVDDMDQNDWLPHIKGLNDVGTEDHDNLYNLIYNNSDNNEILENEKFPDDPQIISGEENDAYDTLSHEYKSFIRGTVTPRQSPVPLCTEKTAIESDAPAARECQIDPSKQIYSYTKWSRSKRPAVKKLCSFDQTSKFLWPSGVPNLRETSRGPDFRGLTDSISVTDKKMEPKTCRTLHDENNLQTKDRLAKKTQKVTLNIKKQNVNLPGLSKNSRSQTVSEDGDKDKQEKKVRPPKGKPKLNTSSYDRPRTEPTTRESTKKISAGETQTVPELMFKDYYMRSLYGYKRRVNSHVDSKLDRGTRKNFTVGSTEQLLQKSRKTPELFKPSHLAFTRSFSFSMFDLPEVYKLYNLTLEGRATGDEGEIN